MKELEESTNLKFSRIHVMGGGSNAEYLNELTAKYTGLPVYAGPSEATATGNLLAQMMQGKEFDSISEARNCVHKSFPIKIYQP